MEGPLVQQLSFSQLLVRSLAQDTKNHGKRALVNPLGCILTVLFSYLPDKTLGELMKVSFSMLTLLVQSKIPIPLSLSVNSDSADGMLLARSKLEALKTETNLRFSIKLQISSARNRWAADLNALLGLEPFLQENDAEFVHSIAFKNLHVGLEEIHKHMVRSISLMQGLRTLDLSGYHFQDKNIFEVHFASKRMLNTLEEVRVNPCSLGVLRILCETNKGLRVLKLHADGGNGKRTDIFSTLSALPVETLTTVSVHFLSVMTREESEELKEFVHRQQRLLNLSLYSCQVSELACDNFVRLLTQTRLEKLKLDSLHMGHPQLLRVVDQIGNMTQLKSLTVTNKHCNEKNAQRLCSGLREMTSLRQLDLSYLCLSAHGVSELAGALTNLQRLQQLDLSNNRFHDIEDVSSFVAALTAFSKLTRLRVGNCGMTEGVRRQMETVLQKQI